MALQLPGEELLEAAHRGVRAEPVEAEPPPRLRRHLDDERAGDAVEPVAVGPHPSGRGLHERTVNESNTRLVPSQMYLFRRRVTAVPKTSSARLRKALPTP